MPIPFNYTPPTSQNNTPTVPGAPAVQKTTGPIPFNYDPKAPVPPVTPPATPTVPTPTTPRLTANIPKPIGIGGPAGINVIPSAIGTVKDTFGSLKTEFGGGPDSVGSKLINDVSEGAKDIQNGNVVKGVVKAGARVAGDTAGAIFAPISAVIGAALKNTGAQKVIDWIGEKGADLSHIADIPAVQDFAMKHPNAGEDFGRALNLILGSQEKGKIEPSTMVDRTIKQVTPAIDSAKATIDTAKTKIAEIPKQVKEQVKPTVNPDRVAGTITQGDIQDIPASKRVLSSVDPTKIKTYSDLSKVLGDNLKEMKAGQDTHTGASDVVKKLPDLTTETKVGDKTVSHNYVSDALDQLKTLYEKINDPTAAAKIDQLKAKAESTGLNSSDVNEIAREHGRVLNAFNANGEASTGLTKQAAENTRTGLKTTAGELSGDAKTFKTNDKAISETIKVKDLVDTMSEKVNDLKQKIQDRGFGEKVGRVIGQAINIVGLNSPKGFIEYFLGRGTGLKTLNPIDLESALQKNLKALQDVLNNKNLSESQVESKVKSIIDDHQKALNQDRKVGDTSKPKTTKILKITKKPTIETTAQKNASIPKNVSQVEKNVKTNIPKGKK